MIWFQDCFGAVNWNQTNYNWNSINRQSYKRDQSSQVNSQFKFKRQLNLNGINAGWFQKSFNIFLFHSWLDLAESIAGFNSNKLKFNSLPKWIMNLVWFEASIDYFRQITVIISGLCIHSGFNTWNVGLIPVWRENQTSTTISFIWFAGIECYLVLGYSFHSWN